jgi:hypothetical protein
VSVLVLVLVLVGTLGPARGSGETGRHAGFRFLCLRA